MRWGGGPWQGSGGRYHGEEGEGEWGRLHNLLPSQCLPAPSSLPSSPLSSTPALSPTQPGPTQSCHCSFCLAGQCWGWARAAATVCPRVMLSGGRGEVSGSKGTGMGAGGRGEQGVGSGGQAQGLRGEGVGSTDMGEAQGGQQCDNVVKRCGDRHWW